MPTPETAAHQTGKAQPKGFFARLLPSKQAQGVVLVAVGGALLWTSIYPYPVKSRTGNPFETPGTQNVQNRFISAGAKDDHQSAVATPLGSQGDVSTPRVQDNKSAMAVSARLKARQMDIGHEESHPNPWKKDDAGPGGAIFPTRPPTATQQSWGETKPE
ncbi:hypothetical protein DOTSEDRAFT_28471 [Dothistroma septosporum NZE10]|uniref:Uncharacterized protein n=1 Tax=Dothistroma septosporum (strain NZE10 / CBS 128990) TaxID=675120 RepID=M2XIL8_DOTSN|nr:hypothetical protein DOTSEDRAFT_28471 [Dothistroma septosporum NZE10]